MSKIEIKDLYLVFGNEKQKALKMLKEGKTKSEILKATGCTIAVKDANLSINEGEIFVIMGLSGSGKSTLLRCINRLIRPTSGEVIINGTDIAKVSDKELLQIRRKELAMVFQNFGLLPHRSVLHNIAFGLELQGVKKGEREQKAMESMQLVGAEKAAQNPNHRGDEEYNYFMAVCFPAEQLTIIDYNRVVKDLNGLTPQAFLEALKKNFVVEETGTDIYKPAALHNFSLYLEGKWYSLTAKPGTYDDNDPIGVLDVTISSNLILDEILGIKDLRSDKRIDFVGGIRGLGELKKRVDSGEMKMALALYPVSMKQLMDIADTGNIMPPKTTWFEPKLRSGLVIHKLE